MSNNKKVKMISKKKNETLLKYKTCRYGQWTSLPTSSISFCSNGNLRNIFQDKVECVKTNLLKGMQNILKIPHSD